jgi:endothelin-converting enzyme
LFCRDILFGDPYATYNPVTFLNFTQTLPQLDFATYLSTFAPRSFPEEVIVTDPSYAKFLSRTLEETPGEFIEAYLVSRAALSLSSNLGLDTEAWKAARTLEEELKGIKKGAVGDRSEFCISTVENTMGFAVGRYFVNETFGQDSKSKGTNVITDIIKSFKGSLPKMDWMDEKSASAATQKVF